MRESFLKALSETDKYIANKQWDLARISIDVAMSLMEQSVKNNYERKNTLCKAYKVYLENGQYDKALEFINRAIFYMPNNANLYRSKQHVLLKYIIHLRRQRLDTSQIITNFRTTCKVWYEKAKFQGDTKSMVEARCVLADSFIKDPPKDFYKADDLLNEALALDPGNARALAIRPLLYQPMRVNQADYMSYDNEVSPYQAEIETLICSITAGGKPLSEDPGWYLCHYMWYESEDPDRNGNWDERTYYYDYFLTENGTFVRKDIKEREILGKNCRYSNTDCKYINVTLAEVMKQMDFKIYIEGSYSKAYTFHGSKPYDPFSVGGRCLFKDIERVSWEKGMGLYNRLMEILKRQQAGHEPNT